MILTRHVSRPWAPLRSRTAGWTALAALLCAAVWNADHAHSADWWNFDPAQWPGCDGNVCTDADAEQDAITIDTVGIAGSTNEQHVGEHHPARVGPKSYARETNGDPPPDCDDADEQPLRVQLAYGCPDTT